MKRTTWIVLALIVAVVGGATWYWLATRNQGVALDLVEAFRGAEKRSPLSATAAFSMDPQTVQGVTRPSVYMHPPSRVIYHAVAVPQGARFRAWLAIKEEAWDKGSDGVVFHVGVSSAGTYTELLNQHVDPYHEPKDRGWVPVERSLAQWAGKQVDVIFNTNVSIPGVAPNDLYDFAVIGSPAIVVVPRT